MEMNKKHDLTTGNPLKKIFLFMVPVLIGNIFQQLYSTVDTVIVGRTLGADALAAVGGTGGIHFIVFGCVSGLSSGVTVLTSQYIGAQDRERASRSVAVIYMIAAVASLIFTVGGVALLPWILKWMNIPEELYARAYSYQIVCFVGLCGTLLYNVEANLNRALGDSITPLIYLIISSLLNIILDFVFILNFHMDVAGAALATVLAQTFSGLACMVHSMRKYELLRIRRESFAFERGFVWRHLKIGLPLSMQDSITGIGVAIFQSALNAMGANAIAAYTACSRVESFSTMPMFAISTALVTYVAQNYGARKQDRIKKGVNAAIKVSLVFSVLTGALIILFSDALVGIFVGRNAVEVLALARKYLFVNASCLWCAALLFVYRAAVQGTGETRIPMIGGFVELAMRIFAAYVLAGIWGFVGLATAYPLAWLFAAFLNIGYYVLVSKKKMGEMAPSQSDL